MLDPFWSQKFSAALRTRICPIKLRLRGIAGQFSVEPHSNPPLAGESSTRSPLPESLRRSLAFLLLSRDMCSDSYTFAHQSHLSAIPIQTNLLCASLTQLAMRLHSAACLRNASTGLIGGLHVQEIGGQTHDVAVGSFRTGSNLGFTL